MIREVLMLIVVVGGILWLQYRFLLYPFKMGLKRYAIPLYRKEVDAKLGKVKLARHHLTQQLMISKWPTQNKEGLSVKSIDGGSARYYMELLYLYGKDESQRCPESVIIDVAIHNSMGASKKLSIPLQAIDSDRYTITTYMGSRNKHPLMIWLMGYMTQGSKPLILARGELSEEQVDALAQAESIKIHSQQVKLVAASSKFSDEQGWILLNKKHFGSYQRNVKQLLNANI